MASLSDRAIGWRVVWVAVMAVAVGGPIAGAWARRPLSSGYVQQGSKLSVAGTQEFGEAVAVAADGATALVSENTGSGTPAVFVYVRSGSGWSQQATLTGGPLGSDFGGSLALSADGNTALVGAGATAPPVGTAGSSYGAVWVYTRSGTTWSAGTEIQPSSEPLGNCYQGMPSMEVVCGSFGSGVALSGDGTEALIGEPGDGSGSAGAAWVYTESGGGWTLATKLVPSASSGAYGEHVALSSDGATALISGAAATALVYTRSSSGWSLQQSLQFPADSGLPERSSTLSANGRTALLGDGSQSSSTPDGIVAVYDRASSGNWSQTGTLANAANAGCANGFCDRFGDNLALAADGDTALVGGFAASGGGAAWAFTRPSTSAGWSQGPAIVPNDESNPPAGVGSSVALSADAGTALIGGPLDNNGQGAAWVFSAGAPSLVVNSTGDLPDTNPGSGVCDTGQTVLSGLPECTLRAAIQTGNADGGGTITFDLPAGSGPIAVSGGLDSITAPLTIDGTGSNPVIKGSGASGVAGFTLAGAGAKLTNLTIENFFDEIVIAGSGGDELDHLTIGPGSATNDLNGCESTTETTGRPSIAAGIIATSPGNQIGPRVEVADVGGCDLALGQGATRNTVGGVALGITSVNGDATQVYPSGVMIMSGSGDVLTGSLGDGTAVPINSVGEPNLVGDLLIGGDGDQVLATQAGDVYVKDGSDETLGSVAAGDVFGNVATGQQCSGPGNPAEPSATNSTVTFDGGTGNTIDGDTIVSGCGAGLWLVGGGHDHMTADTLSGNGTAGQPHTGAIVLDGSSNDTLDGNLIRNNQGGGIVLLDTRGDSVDDTISDNTMYGDHGLGIDLGGTGRPSALNGSPLFASIGPNDLLSYPSFVSVTTHDGQLRLLGSLESVLGGATYTIQVFSNDACNASGYGEGEHQIGTFTVSTTGVGRLTGEAEFDHTLPLNGAPATNVTATTTDSEGNTSEFAACVTGTASLKTNLKRRLKQGAQLLGTGVTNAAQADGTAGIAGGGGITVGGVAPDAGTYGAQVTAPGSGSVSHTLALPARARAVTVMAGSVHVRRAGVFTLKLRLTKAGRKLLRKAKRLTLTITARTAAGPSRAISSTRVNVRRHGPKA